MILKDFRILVLLLCCISSISNAQIIDGYKYIDATPYGGDMALRNIIKSELVYPSQSFEKEVEGSVIIRFEVLKDGKIRNARVTQSVNEELDREAMRLFSKILWQPGIQNEEAIDLEKTIEISFKVNKYKRWVNKRGYSQIDYPHLPVDTSNHLYDLKSLTQAPNPIYRDKSKNMQDFINNNLKYPAEAQQRNIAGVVTVLFVVEQSGNISNTKIINHVGGGCSNEAVRLIKLLKWQPGIREDTAVRAVMELDINFILPTQTSVRSSY